MRYLDMKLSKWITYYFSASTWMTYPQDLTQNQWVKMCPMNFEWKTLPLCYWPHEYELQAGRYWRICSIIFQLWSYPYIIWSLLLCWGNVLSMIELVCFMSLPMSWFWIYSTCTSPSHCIALKGMLKSCLGPRHNHSLVMLICLLRHAPC